MIDNVVVKKEILILTIIITIGAVFRFYNLNWDKGYFFHPDESNNIAHPAARLQYPFKPDRFTYGSFTIYLYKITANTLSLLSNNPNWMQADHINIVGRFYSGVFSIFIIILTYYLGQLIFSKLTGLLAAAFTSFNVGLIQAAHFGTTETILTLSAVSITLAAILIQKKQVEIWGYILNAFTLGIACGSKMIGLVFLSPFLLAHLFSLSKKNVLQKNFLLVCSLLLAFLIFFFVFPYSILDFNSFRDNFELEKAIAEGKIPIFYTTHFTDAFSYIFQAYNIFPWILGLPVLILGLSGFFYVLYQSLRLQNKFLFILCLVPAVYFVYTGYLFVKWTRYTIPLIPFFCIFAGKLLSDFYEKSINFKKVIVLLTIVILIFQYLYVIAFMQIYIRPDTRISASLWIYQNVPPRSSLLLELFDVVSLPLQINNFDSSIYEKQFFNFYALDENPTLLDDLVDKLYSSEFIIIGSRRVYDNRGRFSNKFPLTANYYNRLFDGTLGFTKVKEITSYPQILNIQINDDAAEETFQGFDHPKVVIFKKGNILNKEDLINLLSKKG